MNFNRPYAAAYLFALAQSAMAKLRGNATSSPTDVYAPHQPDEIGNYYDLSPLNKTENGIAEGVIVAGSAVVAILLLVVAPVLITLERKNKVSQQHNSQALLPAGNANTETDQTANRPSTLSSGM